MFLSAITRLVEICHARSLSLWFERIIRFYGVLKHRAGKRDNGASLAEHPSSWHKECANERLVGYKKGENND